MLPCRLALACALCCRCSKTDIEACPSSTGRSSGSCTGPRIKILASRMAPQFLAISPFPLSRLREQPGQPTPEILSYLLNILRENTRVDALAGPRYLLPVVYPQLSLIEQLCQSAHEPERRATLFIGAKFAEFCGWLCQDSGNTDSALYWTNQALDYAHELDDPELLAYILTRKSNIVTEAGTPGHGLGLANAALNISGHVAPAVRAVSLRHRARAHCLLSEKNEFERDTSEALAYAADSQSK